MTDKSYTFVDPSPSSMDQPRTQLLAIRGNGIWRPEHLPLPLQPGFHLELPLAGRPQLSRPTRRQSAKLWFARMRQAAAILLLLVTISCTSGQVGLAGGAPAPQIAYLSPPLADPAAPAAGPSTNHITLSWTCPPGEILTNTAFQLWTAGDPAARTQFILVTPPAIGAAMAHTNRLIITNLSQAWTLQTNLIGQTNLTLPIQPGAHFFRLESFRIQPNLWLP